ncbi:MAG: hypothetical protein KDD58_05625 [Bdellovibrionales bacterium]|nr:hypothetical protein [Bdellovibrionales bacterium]
MKDAVFRLLAISISVLMVTILIIFGLNWLGSQQKFAPLDHPLLNNDPHYFIATQESISNQKSLKYEQIIPLVYLTTDRDSWYITDHNFKEKKQDFDSYLQQNPLSKVALFVNSRINLGALVKSLFDSNLQENVLIFANEQKIIIELKKMAPRWLYSANPSQKMRLKVMDSFWIGSLSQYDFDFIVINPQEKEVLNNRLVNELQKRFKKIIYQTENIPKEFPSYIDGVLFL